MSREEPHRAAFKAAAQATKARILRDRAQAPTSMKKVFTLVARRFCEPEFRATEAWKEAGVRSCAQRASFEESTGSLLKHYIEAARIEVANVLMVTTDLKLSMISLWVGYLNHQTFNANYMRIHGRRPRDVPRELPKKPVIDDATALNASRGLLSADELVGFVADLVRIYPAASGRITIDEVKAEREPTPRIRVDGARADRLQAEGLWREIRGLSFEEQREQVRRYFFCSTVLFDFLRETSRREGRKDRQRGVELAELALVSLEGSEEVFGERIHDLRALGWAWLGNAYTLALEFQASAAAFGRASREWAMPRSQPDQVIWANVCNLRGSLRMMLRDYDLATQDLDLSCALLRQAGDAPSEALALTQRAAIHGYAGKINEALSDLREAAGLIDGDQQRELAFAIRGNLANALIRAGRAECAAVELGRARLMVEDSSDPMGAIKLDYIEGDLADLQGNFERAKSLYLGVHTSARAAGDLEYFSIVSVDLMAAHAREREWEYVRMLAAEALPILGSLRLHDETLAVVALLAAAAEDGRLSLKLLSELRCALRQDPLAL